MVEALKKKAKEMLKSLIETPSISKEEEQTAEIIAQFLSEQGIQHHRKHNNIWAYLSNFDRDKPSILLNSHHDTVKPHQAYTRDPFSPTEEQGRIYGLGSNDAGASLVGLWATFVHYNQYKNLKYNLIFAATAEEEISGQNGIQTLLPEIGTIDFAVVGEPTQMNVAIAEKGLIVIDCTAKGTPTHTAHENPDNAIYNAIEDINKIKNYTFSRISPLLGKTKATVSMISGGQAHNVTPATVNFTIDVRTNELYTNQEVAEIIRNLLTSEVKPRSLRLNPSRFSIEHPFVKAAQKEGALLFGSPTLSDQALIPFPSVKIGIGDSARSHSADEFIYTQELYSGIEKYIKILSHLL